MTRCRHYIMFLTVFLAGFFITSSCNKIYPRESGFLEGIISIGPLCPVEKIPPDPGCLPTAETYKAYPVGIWTSNGRRKIARINPALDGSYRIDLYPGDYVVKLELNRNQIGSSNLPAEVSIKSEKITVLDIDIDTGIR